MKKLATVFVLFFTSFIVLPATNKSLKYISLGLDKSPLTLGKNLATSKNEKQLAQGRELSVVYNQSQATCVSPILSKNTFISRNRVSVISELFVEFSACNRGTSAKERTPT